MSLRRTLDVMGAMVERAASVPLSASCMVNRAEMLSLVERARAELPVELDEAAALLVAHQDVIARAELEADEIVVRARTEADDLIEDSALVATARARSEAILDAARNEAARLLREADEYCDSRLAGFEADLEKLTTQVRNGRRRLHERSDLDQPGAVAEDADDQYSADQYSADQYGADLYGAGQADQHGAETGVPAAEPADRPSQYVYVEEVQEEVAFDQEWVEEKEWADPDAERTPAAVGASERRVVDVAQLERDAAERGLGQPVNLQ
jgi:vacuolar-type H+-ATPase subunit H